MTPEKYLVDETPPPLDEDEIREALQQTLRARAPPALVSLVGRPAYSRCAHSHAAHHVVQNVAVIIVLLFFQVSVLLIDLLLLSLSSW